MEYLISKSRSANIAVKYIKVHCLSYKGLNMHVIPIKILKEIFP